MKLIALALLTAFLVLSMAQAQSPEVSTAHTGLQCRLWNGLSDMARISYLMGYGEGLDMGAETFSHAIIKAGQSVDVGAWKGADVELNRSFPRKLTFVEITGRLNNYCSVPEHTSTPINKALIEIAF